VRTTILGGILGGSLSLLLGGCVNMPAAQTSLIPNAPVGSGPSKAPPELPTSETVKVCLTTAETLERGGKDLEAIGLYERARQLDPTLPHLDRHLGVLYDRVGMADNARAEFERALQKAPHDPDLLNDLGYSCYNQGQWDQAEKHLRLALAHDANHGRAWINLGMTLSQKGQYEDSLEAFKKAVSPGQAYCNVAFVLTAQGRRDDARRAYREALHLEPGLQLARSALAKLDAADAGPSKAPTAAKQATSTQRAPVPAVSRTNDEPVSVSPGDDSQPPARRSSTTSAEPKR
jgi:Flp pilus assembly protein TadD